MKDEAFRIFLVNIKRSLGMFIAAIDSYLKAEKEKPSSGASD